MSLCTKQPCTGRNTQTPGYFNTQTPVPSTTPRCAALLCTAMVSTALHSCVQQGRAAQGYVIGGWECL